MSKEILAARQQMVQHQLQIRGICDRRVLAAIASVPREEFVPTERREQAYADRALPLQQDCRGQQVIRTGSGTMFFKLWLTLGCLNFGV